MANKYYWLKLKRDFFKRHDIRIVEDMPNGKDYILFYLKLLVESVDHEGNLRFNDTIPYNENMLSAVTNTNIDIVRAAMEVFKELELIEVLDDKTIYMTEIQSMLGSETEWARKKREYRKGQIEDKTRTKKDNVRQEIEKEIDIDIDIDKEKIKKEKAEKNIIPPTLEMVQAYISKMGYHINAQAFINHYDSKGWMIGKNKMKDWQAATRTWETRWKEDHPQCKQDVMAMAAGLEKEMEAKYGRKDT